jgi:type VI secretion system protein ImpL
VSSASGWLSQIGIVTGLVAAAVALALAGWMLFRRAPRVLAWTVAALAVVGLGVVFEWVLPRRYPEFDRGLPAFAGRTWTWIYGFTVTCLAATVALVQGLVRPRPMSGDEPESTGAVGAAWEATRMGLSQAGIDPARQDVHLVLAPDHDSVEALVRASGVPVLATAPEAASPLRAYATADGLYLSAAGACGLAGGDGSELDALAGLLNGLDPDLPVVRTIVLLVPLELASRRDAPRQAALLRDDLRAVGDRLRRHLPMFLLFPGAEELPGLEELIGRMPEASRGGRCGFALPRAGNPAGAETVGRGLAWLSGWFESWCLSAMAGDPERTAGNGRLYQLLTEVRRRRPRWREAAEAACATPPGRRPPSLRGVYLAATGPLPARQAFAAGLLRGPRGRIPAESDAGEWSDAAWRDDRRYRRLALAVGLVGGGLALFAWTVIMRPEGTRAWWLPFLGLVAAWVAVIGRMLLRGAGARDA